MSANKENDVNVANSVKLLTEMKLQIESTKGMNVENAIHVLVSMMYDEDDLQGVSIPEFFQGLMRTTPLALRILKETAQISSADGSEFFEALACGLLAKDVMEMWHRELTVQFKKWLLQGIDFQDADDTVFESMDSQDVISIFKSDPEVFAIFERSAGASSDENRKRMEEYRKRHNIARVDLLQLALR